MSIASTDLIAYAAANQPEDDTSPAGGAVDANTRIVFTDLAANDDVEVVSSDAGDTMNATLRGRKADGTLVSETVALNGATAVIFSTIGVLERVESFALASAAAGTVTVRRSVAGATIATVPAGELGFKRLFIKAFSAAAPKDYYAKIFLKNAHGSLALLSASVVENADPTGLVTFALENTIGDSHTVANRLSAPANATAFDSATKTLATATGTADLAAGSAIGVWLKLSLAGDNAPIKNTYAIELDGQST